MRPGVLQGVRPVLACALLLLGWLSACRLGLAVWQHDAVAAADGWLPVLLQGVRVDVATVCLLLGIPAAVVVLLPSRSVQRMVAVWLTLVITVVVFLELATPEFMAEYGLRPNRLFLEYLVYPREVLSTLWESRRWQVLSAPVLLAAVVWGGWRLVGRHGAENATMRRRSVPLWQRALAAVMVLLAALLGARSTLGHRPLNPAMVAFSSDPTVNQLPLNSFYALAHAARQWHREEDDAIDVYGGLPEAEVIAAVRAASGLPDSAFTDPSLPTLAARPPVWQGTPRNVVIVLEESLGAQFIGHLGGLPLSPEIDRLSGQAWTFERLYATGTRSVRGIEAVVAGFSPTPAQAVVKQPAAQYDFYTLARSFQAHGYDTTFYYGGESHFDNMRGFFFGNGFGRVIEQKDFRKPAFVGSWGVSDEDLLLRAHEEFSALHRAGKPFFGLVFSSSNHDPFEFPDGRITLHEQPKNTRNNAAKYADYAVGRFFDKAMAADYWKDTVFLVVADHDSRVFGRTLVPVEDFHIPGMLLGGGIAPRRDTRLVSQIDLGPTLLSLAGIGDATPMNGRDLADATLSLPGRALMQYDANFAWMEEDQVVILQPDHPALQFRYDHRNKRMATAALDPALAYRAHAQALWGSLAYQKGWYRLPAH